MNKRVSGFLCLIRQSNNFQLIWSPFDPSTGESIFQPIKIPTTDQWAKNGPFIFDCKEVFFIQFSENPLTLTIFRNNEGNHTYLIPESEFISVVQLVEQLILNGIAVPCKEPSYSLEFYKRCREGVYSYTPPPLKLNYKPYTTLSNFWLDVHHFFTELMIYLDSSGTVPLDTDFPLASAARACHELVMNEINDYLSKVPQYTQITKSEIPTLFDSNGRLIDPELFLHRAYHSGIEPSALPDLLPFVFGVYSYDSTSEEREKIRADLQNEFSILKSQVESKLPIQIQNSKKTTDDYRVISHDVARTDRGLSSFKNLKGTGPKILAELLHVSTQYDPELGYLQGMNDLFVPIMLSYIPLWNDDSEPINESGEIIDCSNVLYIIFWCFQRMLTKTKQLELLADVTECCKKRAATVIHLLSSVSPVAAIWMRNRGMQDLLWCYSDFLLMFKRTYADVWSVWLKFSCSLKPDKWLCYFTCAMIIACFEKLTLEKDTSLTAMMDAFPKRVSEMDVETVGSIALWLCEKVPLPDDEEIDDGDEEIEKFDFFEALCTK
ncbi:TBC domain containing protein [Histomonas meleagridis]|uniref:TBC domain containing protein n=1 Tax=Histomonas meleagridis TaxID=135588 RepID=UPI00355A7000|nr:TBC domain containing protein [Histomonas meleagridis]KAH0798667.1 TBC domain containing protein [Histomonas meleagridis]